MNLYVLLPIVAGIAGVVVSLVRWLPTTVIELGLPLHSPTTESLPLSPEEGTSRRSSSYPEWYSDSRT